MAVMGMDGSLVKVFDSMHRSVGVCVTKQVAEIFSLPKLSYRELQEGGQTVGFLP